MADISVVISTFGNYSVLGRVLDTYESQRDADGAFEVLVVVDAADPDPAAAEAAAGSRPYPLRLLRGPIPGLSANRNAGVAAAQTPLVLFTDNDCLASPRLVAEHLAWHARNPDPSVAVLGHVRWARELRVTPFMRWLDDGIQFQYPYIRGIDAGWGRFFGANVSVKGDLVGLAGGFDEQRFPYGYEDLEFAKRASAHGLRVLYNRDAVVEHLREMDLAMWKRRVRRLAFAERQLTRVHPDIPPYYHPRFVGAAASPPARGRGRRLITWLPRRTPVIGSLSWESADRYYSQALAPYFLDAWEEAEATLADGRPLAPDVSELEPADAPK